VVVVGAGGVAVVTVGVAVTVVVTVAVTVALFGIMIYHESKNDPFNK
jgi:hypothetical protein